MFASESAQVGGETLGVYAVGHSGEGAALGRVTQLRPALKGLGVKD